MKVPLWTGQNGICVCGHHVESHYTEGKKRGCNLCKECNEFIADSFYAGSICADEILERI